MVIQVRLIDTDKIKIKPEYMHDICGSAMIRVEDVARIINDMPTITQPEWIPCSERLPEEKTDVLLAFKNNMVVGFWEDILNDGSVVWYANSGDGWLTQAEADYNDGIPLAWKPLPEPYKDGTE